jgi:hypothetical protein
VIGATRMGGQHPERFRCGGDWTMERVPGTAGAVRFRKWGRLEDGKAVEIDGFTIEAEKWPAAVTHVSAPERLTRPENRRLVRHEVELIHFGAAALAARGDEDP